MGKVRYSRGKELHGVRIGYDKGIVSLEKCWFFWVKMKKLGWVMSGSKNSNSLNKICHKFVHILEREGG